MTRGQFLNFTWRSFLQTGLFLFKELVEAEEGVWESLGTVKEFIKPRLTAIRGTYILVTQREDKVWTYVALCPKDGGPLQWAGGDMLSCAWCSSQYSTLTGQNESGGPGLEPLPVKIADGRIWVKLG